MSINDLLAFASGAQFTIESNAMVTIDDDLAERTGLKVGTEWLAVRGYRQADGAAAPICTTEYYINRAFAAVGSLLQRHSGSDLPAHRGPVRGQHRRGAPRDRRDRRSRLNWRTR